MPTKKNKIVSDIYRELGFSMVDENNGNLTYELNLSEYDIPKNKNITLKKEQK
jgi:predicted enzyme involved in methoxymalonyl-ACP biosynthesis